MVNPNNAFTGGAIIYIEILTGGFYFISQCTSSLGVCSITNSLTTAMIVYEGDMTATTKFTVSLSVNNPYVVATSGLRVSYFSKLGSDPYG